jgi:hypothetical protein
MSQGYGDFVKIKADTHVDVIKSLCMSCKEDGETRLMTTKIPFFKGKWLGLHFRRCRTHFEQITYHFMYRCDIVVIQL